MASEIESSPDADIIGRVSSAARQIREELSKVIIGQDDVVQQVLMAIFTRSHALLVGVPGLAKTLLVSTLADTLDLSFKRIQFTPDLMPSDITGMEVMHQDAQTQQREFRFMQGPIFANIILADEINRTPPKTQAAMLEAMQERCVSIAGENHPLPSPFFVLATQNPIEQEGTYPLPEAQLDRFMFNILVNYPTEEEEFAIMKTYSQPQTVRSTAVLSAEEILKIQQAVLEVPVADHVIRYAERLVRVTRPNSDQALDACNRWLTWGAGPRAGLNLLLAAKAYALLNGQNYVSCDNVASVAPPIFRHRLVVNFAARSDGIDSDAVTQMILDAIPKDRNLAK